MSPILGGMLTIDWLGVLITHLAASIIGIPTKNIPISIGGGLALMIPWLAFRTQEIGPVLYAIAMNALLWYAIRPETRSYTKLKKAGKLSSLTDSESWRLMRSQESKDATSTASTVYKRILRWLKPEDNKDPRDEEVSD